MKLLCSMTTFNRLDYTRRTIESLLETAGDDFHLVVVDNNSEDGTQDYLTSLDDDITVILLPANLYPGAATNRGWHEGLKVHEAFLLMRSDNDIEYLPGWREKVNDAFTAFPELGQLGLLNRHEDYDDHQPVTELRRKGVSINVEWTQVGGNCVIPRRLWEMGLRWEAGAWSPGGQDEDSRMSSIIRQNGLVVGEVIPTVCNNMSFHRYEDFPDYYTQTAGMRGLVPEMSV